MKKIIVFVLIVIFVGVLIFASYYISNKSSNVTTSTASGEVKDASSSRNLTLENFDEKVLKNDKKVLVDFYADWCEPCQELSPILEKVLSKHKDVDYYKVNVDEEETLATRYRIYYLPSVIIFKDGEIINSSFGLIDEELIEELLK